MRFYIPSIAAGLVLAAGIPAANAQTVITPEVVNPPFETIQTTETVRSVRPAPLRPVRRIARSQVVTTRTITREVVPTPAVAVAVPVAPPPLYDAAVPAPIAADDYAPPLYDMAVPAAVVPAAAVAATPVVEDGAVVATAPIIYRYVYEPDRILVVDPTTGVAVQSIPR